jgi:hypothetical protein
LNFNDLGANATQEMNAFKRVRMFSKTFTSNLVYSPNTFSNKYKNLTHLYLNDTTYADSYLYGLKRQHNYLSINSLFNNNATFLNLNSVNKIINYNFKTSRNLHNLPNQISSFNFFEKPSNLTLDNSILKLNILLNNLVYSNNFTFFNNSSIYNNFLSLINDNSDKKKISNSIFKLFNLKLKKNIFLNTSNLNLLNSSTDSTIFSSNNEIENFFFNSSKSYKIATVFSSNQSVNLTDKHVRNFVKTSPFSSHFNYSLNLNPLSNYLSLVNSNSGLSTFFFYNLENLN